MPPDAPPPPPADNPPPSGPSADHTAPDDAPIADRRAEFERLTREGRSAERPEQSAEDYIRHKREIVRKGPSQD